MSIQVRQPVALTRPGINGHAAIKQILPEIITMKIDIHSEKPNYVICFVMVDAGITNIFVC